MADRAEHDSPGFNLPIHLNKKRLNARSRKSIMLAAQTNSDNNRKTPVTLPKPDWERDLSGKG